MHRLKRKVFHKIKLFVLKKISQIKRSELSQTAYKASALHHKIKQVNKILACQSVNDPITTWSVLNVQITFIELK